MMYNGFSSLNSVDEKENHGLKVFTGVGGTGLIVLQR